MASFRAHLLTLSGAARERAILELAQAGELDPADWQTITTIGAPPGGTGEDLHSLSLEVSRDYVSKDGIRLPMLPGTASAVARLRGALLPTPRIVDLVWQSAEVRLEPIPRGPTPDPASSAAFVLHNDQIEAARAGRGGLIAGVKKDVVVVRDTWKDAGGVDRAGLLPGHLYIYGWHHTNGAPIQPWRNPHGAGFVDYSHGVRLVRRRCLLDGVEAELADVLRGPFSYLVSKEGPLVELEYPPGGGGSGGGGSGSGGGWLRRMAPTLALGGLFGLAVGVGAALASSRASAASGRG